MFAKLLKYEWKATSGLLGVLTLAAVGVGALLTVLLRFLQAAPADTPELLLAPVSTILIGGFLAVVAYAIGTQIVLLVRFYKNKYSNEGYLTFTLPVTAHQILLSSLLNYLIWTVISVAVVLAVFTIAIFVGSASKGFYNKEAWDAMIQIIRMLSYQEGLVDYIVTILVNSAVSSLASVVLVHTAITLGAVIAKKHKILAAFGCYYGISMIMGIISSVLMVGIGLMSSVLTTADQLFGGMNIIMILQAVLYVVIAVIGYFVSHYLMKNKLNLP